jgi:hypothetical protein
MDSENDDLEFPDRAGQAKGMPELQESAMERAKTGL